MKKNISVASLVGGNGGMGRSKQSPALFILAIFLLVAVGAGAFYLSFEKSAISDHQKQLDTEVASLNTQIDDLKSQKIEAAQTAKSWVQDIEKDEVRWSTVLKGLDDLIPLDPSSGKPKIRFLSYSGSTGGKLTLNAETLPSPQPPFADVGQLVNLFNSSHFFKDAYVPSISRGLSETGDTILSFIFNVTYLEEPSTSVPLSNLTTPSSGEVVSPASSDNSQVPADTSSTVKIPRK